MDVRAGAFLTVAYFSRNSRSLQPINYFKGFNQSRQSADCLNDAYLHSLHTTIQTSIQNMTKIQKISLLSRSNCIIIMLFTVCFQDSKNYATLYVLWYIQFLFWGFHLVAKIIRKLKSHIIPYKFKCSHWCKIALQSECCNFNQ